MGSPNVDREQLPQVSPRALDESEQRMLLRAVERCPSARDRAIITTMLYTGLRLSELTALVVTDVAVTARKGAVTVRSGKGDRYRRVPLNSACRLALHEWLEQRTDLTGLRNITTGALWLSRLRTPMSVRAVGHVIERVAADAGLHGVSATCAASHLCHQPDSVRYRRSARSRTRRPPAPRHHPPLQPPVRIRPGRSSRNGNRRALNPPRPATSCPHQPYPTLNCKP